MVVVKKGKAGGGGGGGAGGAEDPRFAGAGVDPRFQNVPKAKKKVRIFAGGVLGARE